MSHKNILIIPLVLLFCISCGNKNGMKGVDLSVQLLPDTITDKLFVTMNYKYILGPNFAKLAKNYQVFTHFWRSSIKEMLLVDDHMPPKNTSEWSPGETISYSRTLFIPQFLNEFDIDFEGYEEIRLSIGLYDPKATQKEKPIIILEKKLNIQPASLNAPEIVFSDGWEEEESDLKSNDPFYKNWRWTNKEATCIIDNPKTTSSLIIKGGTNKVVLPDQKITIKINDKILDEFVPELNVFSKEYTITPDILGTGDEFYLKIETDKVFIPARVDPASKDTRELGIQIFFLYFRQKPQ